MAAAANPEESSGEPINVDTTRGDAEDTGANETSPTGDNKFQTAIAAWRSKHLLNEYR